MPRGEGRRCSGFVSSDGQYIHCSREQYAGNLPLHAGSGTYAHRASGPCKCGVEHAPAAATTAPATIARIAATYDYRDAAGTVLFQTVRFDPKKFRQRRPNPDRPGEWIWNLDGVTPCLYKLADLQAAAEKAVLVCEGEKDVEALTKLGLLATCNALGAGKWRPEYTAALAGRHVAVLADNDDVGRKHALDVANQLAIVAASVRFVQFADLPEHGDVSDWLAKPGHDRPALEKLIKETPAWGKERREAPPRHIVIPTARELLAKVLPEPKMVVEGLMPEGTTLVVGGPKVGKTLLMEHIAIAVTQGGYVLGKIKVEAGRAVYLALEDGERLSQKRIRTLLHGEECPERLHIQHTWRRFDDGGLEDLDSWLSEHKDTRLVVIDTLARVRARDDGKQGVYDRDYQALAPLTDLSHKHNCAIVVIHHTRKMQADDLMDMISGSAALGAAVDAVLVLQRERFGIDGTIGVMGRDLEEAKFAVSWDKELQQLRIEGNAEEFARSKEQNAILSVLKKAARPLHIQDIADLLGRAANSTLRWLLSRMVESKLVESTGRGEYKASEQAKVAGEDAPNRWFVGDVGGECADEDGEATPAGEPSILDPFDGAIAPDLDPETEDRVTTNNTNKPTSPAMPRTVNGCPSCGHTVSKPAAYDSDEIICAHCYVPLSGPLATHLGPAIERDF